MIRKFIDYFSHNKYRLTMFALLTGGTIFSVLIWRVRLVRCDAVDLVRVHRSASWHGSLFLMQELIRREFGRWVGWGFVAAVAGLSSAGVYVRRFLRWNSWDIFSNPAGMAQYTIQSAQDPSLQSIGFTSLFMAFFLFLYITLYTFGHLLLERQKNEST